MGESSLTDTDVSRQAPETVSVLFFDTVSSQFLAGTVRFQVWCFHKPLMENPVQLYHPSLAQN